MASTVSFIGVKGQGQKPAQADHLGLKIPDRLGELGRRHIHAQIKDIEAVDIEHKGDNVLANVVNVALRPCQ